jgi:hypothetical protein
VVSFLIDQYSDQFALIEYHTQGDGFDTPWGQSRLDDFYGGWCGNAIPVMMYDGFWYPLDVGDYERDLLQQLAQPTDVTIAVTATEVATARWAFTSEVCVEASGAGKRMRIYAVHAQDRYPTQPSYSRNTQVQDAPTVDVDLDPGQCAEVDFVFEFGPDFWGDRENIRIVVWAQETADLAPANVFQAAEVGWPFPEGGGGPVEPELGRDFELALPLFNAEQSPWLAEAYNADVIDASANQIQATYQALCGDTTYHVPEDDPPTADSPALRVAYDEDSVPVFLAGGGSQQVTLCDYDGIQQVPNSKWGTSTGGGPIDIPSCVGDVRPSGPQGLDSNGRLVLYDPLTLTEYDFWQASTVIDAPCLSRGAGLSGSSIAEAGQADYFEVDAAGTNPMRTVGARAASTPLLAGTLLPEDVTRSLVEHALAVGIPGLRNLSSNPDVPLGSDIVPPAAHTQTRRYSTNPNALAAGQRLRLLPELVDSTGEPVNEGALAPVTRAVLLALRTYGAYVVDDADGFVLYAEDLHTATLDLTEDEVNQLIGRPAGTPLPDGVTAWQIIMDALAADFADIPFAFGDCDGASSQVAIPNFEVVEPPFEVPGVTVPPRRPSGRMMP